MIKVKLLGQLKNEAGWDSIEIPVDKEEHTLSEVLSLLLEEPSIRKYFADGLRPRHDIILFINGRDYRVYEEEHVFKGPVEVVFIPISHGGIELEYVEWSQIEEYTSIIAEAVKEDGYRVDVIVGIMRGGVIPARLAADYLGVRNIGFIEIMFYQKPGETRQKPVIRQPLTLDISDKNVLIVDDVSDTGKSLQVAVSAVSLYGPSQVKTATLYLKPWTTFVPDYYAASSDKWIVFPWERNEVKSELQ